mgnify:FL=1
MACTQQTKALWWEWLQYDEESITLITYCLFKPWKLIQPVFHLFCSISRNVIRCYVDGQ